MISTVFVFYKFKNIDSWTYELPGNWIWIGSGSTESIREPHPYYEYTKEEQFQGQLDKRDEVIQYLDTYFTGLKGQDIIEKYKIDTTYTPDSS